MPDKLANGVFGDDLKNYAWAWLIVGAILLISSFLLLVGSAVRALGRLHLRRRSWASAP